MSSSVSGRDRFFGSLPYLIPLIYVFPYSLSLLKQLPFLTLLYAPLAPVMQLLAIPFMDLILFFVLFLAVVRNPRVPHFIRLNAMQAILIDILLFLVGLLAGFLLNGLPALLGETLQNIIFLGTLSLCIYGIVQSVRGQIADIPTITEAASSQVPW